MKLCFLLFSIAICQLSLVPELLSQNPGKAQPADSLPDTIKWSPDYRLTFEDFQQKKANPVNLRYDSAQPNLLAYSRVGVEYDLKMEKQKLVLHTFAVFRRSKSWISCNDQRVLEHEQTHFDIAEIYAKKFRKRMVDYPGPGSPTYWQTFQQTYQEIQKEHLDEQHYFDDIAVTRLGEDFYIKKVRDELAKMDQ